jgi:N-methylhydantoinase A
LRENDAASLAPLGRDTRREGVRSVYFAGDGWLNADVRSFESIACGERLTGPVIIESPFTSIVVDPGAVAVRRPSGSLSIVPGTALAAEEARR